MWGRYFKIQKKPLSAAAKQYMKDYAFPLFVAVHGNNLDVFRELIEYDSKSVQAVDDIKTPILYEVFAARNLDMARILLENGANPDVMLTFFSPSRSLIVQAIAATQKSFVELLIEHGSSIDKEEGGLSVRKILNAPQQYAKILFNNDITCPGATRFLEKAQEMKQLVEKLRQRPAVLEIPAPAPPFGAQLRQRSLPIPLSQNDDQTPSSSINPNSYP